MLKVVSICAVLLVAVPSVALGQYYWCSDQDDVWAEVADDQVVIHHDAALYNCCPSGFTYTLSEEDGQVVLTEEEVLVFPCYCLCCYNLTATLSDLEPGDNSLLFRWHDGEANADAEVLLEFTVPTGPALAAKAQVSGHDRSECLSEAAGVPEEEPSTRSWDGLKALYR